MPTLPSHAIFCCESCGKQLVTDERMGNHLIPWKRLLAIEPNGSCSACHGTSWTLSVIYLETSADIGPTMVGLGLGAVTGIGFTQSTTASNQMNYPNIPAAVVAKFNDDPRSRMHRISEFVTSIDRQRAIDGGAKECISCGMLYAPAAGKVWTRKGYCSKSCFVESEPDSSEGKTPPSSTVGSAFRPTIQVKCKEGHQFEILASFRGTVRPCPKCGIKTRVPDGNS
jgi:hypothetical protein